MYSYDSISIKGSGTQTTIKFAQELNKLVTINQI